MYHSELVVQRESQRNFRADAEDVKSLTAVKNNIKWELECWTQQLEALRCQPGSPTSGAQAPIKATIAQLEKRLEQVHALTVSPTAHMPRGMICRVSLQLQGGPAQDYTSNVMCHQDGCTQLSGLAALKSKHPPSG